MAAETEYGTVRQAWFAKLDDLDTKWSFLFRDDAYSRQGVVRGRTIRLGDPVTTGPNSTWLQEGWEGGAQQERWSDKVMYWKGNADGTRDKGKLQLHNGWKYVHGHKTKALTRYTLSEGVPYKGGTNLLLMGECYHIFAYRTGEIPSTYSLIEYNNDTGSLDVRKSDFDGSVNAICQMTHESAGDDGWFLIGLDNGKIWWYRQTTGALTQDTNATASVRIQENGIIVYNNAVVIAADNRLWKRTLAGPTSLLGVYKDITKIHAAYAVYAPVVWQNRVWFGALYGSGRTSMYVTDTVTTTHAFTFPDHFRLQATQVHYGSLYMLGLGLDRSPSYGGTGSTLQLWRYDGASLTLVYEAGRQPEEAGAYMGTALCAHGKYLVFPRNGLQGWEGRVGLVFYDAEEDAIVDGPGFPLDENADRVWVGDVIQWGDTLAASFVDDKDYGGSPDIHGPTVVAHVRGNQLRRNTGFATPFDSRSFGVIDADPEQYILSSEYDGEIPEEEKVWLNIRLNCQVPQDTEIDVIAIMDRGSEQTLTTIQYDSGEGSGWRSVVVPVKGGDGKYLRSKIAQYKLVLRNESASSGSTATPVVDSIATDFRLAPTKRLQWQIRAQCSDGQDTLAGSANSLSTRAAMVAKLQELWSDQDAIAFWDMGTSGTTPDNGDAIEVTVESFLENSYRVASDETDVNSEVSLTLLEVA